MAIILNGTTGITTPDIDSTAGFDGEDLTGDVAAARITGALNATGSAPIYACRAWVNFNGSGTVAIRASGNVSSITDNGVGDYTVNFATAMPDVNYATMLTGAGSTASDYPLVSVLTGGNPATNSPTLYSTTQVRIRLGTSSATFANNDTTYYGVAIFR